MGNKKRKRRLSKKKLSTLTVVSVVLATSFLNSKKESSSKNEEVQAASRIENTQEDINKEEKIIEKSVFKVVIDASFGGSDGGSKGYNNILQKNVNLDIALKMKEILEMHEDIEVVLTRDKDVTMSIDERVEIINNSGADLLVSIMQNNEGTGTVKGVESYILPREHKMSNTTFGYTLQQAMAMYVDTNDRGVLAKNLDILLKSSVPGAVVNTGFISNKEEGTNLSSESYQLRMAEGLSQGILSYIDKHLKE